MLYLDQLRSLASKITMDGQTFTEGWLLNLFCFVFVSDQLQCDLVMEDFIINLFP